MIAIDGRLTVLPISVMIPLGERPEMFRMLRFLPLAGSAIYGIATFAAFG
jgi:hypothetical protein